MKKIIKSVLAITLWIVIGFSLAACKADDNQAKQQKQTRVITAKLKSIVTPLYFNGVLKPLKVIPVTSPVAGRIAAVKFQYGEDVMKNEELVTIDSEELSKAFREAVTSYLQKKDEYDNAVESFQGTKALYKAGVISRETFLTSRSQFQNTALGYLQSEFQLDKTLQKAKVDRKMIEGLTLGDTERVNALLKKQFTNIMVLSPGTGVALFPTQSDSSSSSDDGKCSILQVGCEVKPGGLMLNIGDLSGFSVVIQVSEININRIKKGMNAVITGDSFPGLMLKGKVTSVASQATPQGNGGSSGGLSQFTVNVKVPTITEDEKKVIHVGMTAKLKIEIKESPKVYLPGSAVTIKNGQSTVTLLTKTGQKKQVSVQTGMTTPQGEVAIEMGVKPGDKVVVPE